MITLLRLSVLDGEQVVVVAVVVAGGEAAEAGMVVVAVVVSVSWDDPFTWVLCVVP
jgi:hypothetical protein